MAAVRTMGRIGWTSEICAEIQPVSASASSTITKVTAALGGPGISMIASQGRTAPAAKAAPTASASRNGEASEAGVMPCSTSACTASASCAVSSTATCRARRRGKTAGHIQLRELIEFGIGYGLELDSFAGQLGHLLVPLGTCLGVLDGPRGETSGHEPGEPCEYEHLRAHSRARESLTYPSRCKDSVAGLGHVRTDPLGEPSR